MDGLIREKPGHLRPEQRVSRLARRAYKVLDKEAYMNGLVATLVAAGLCAERDVDDALRETIRVKDSNEFSEDFDVLLDAELHATGRRRLCGDLHASELPGGQAAGRTSVGSGCYRPFPPPLYKMNCRTYLNAGDHHVIDSTPIVANPAYCAAIGYTDGVASARSVPTARSIASPARTGAWARRRTRAGWDRPGPGRDRARYCTNAESGCRNSPDSQYQLWAYHAAGTGSAQHERRHCAVTGTWTAE